VCKEGKRLAAHRADLATSEALTELGVADYQVDTAGSACSAHLALCAIVMLNARAHMQLSERSQGAKHCS
jgi:hypothetical protein